MQIKVLRERVEGLYQKLSEITHQTPEAFYFNDFKLKGGKLYYKCKSKPLTIRKRKLRSVGEIAKALGKTGLCDLGFCILMGKVMAQEAIKLNRVEKELTSTSDVFKADDIELQAITKKYSKKHG